MSRESELKIQAACQRIEKYGGTINESLKSILAVIGDLDETDQKICISKLMATPKGASCINILKAVMLPNLQVKMKSL